MADLAAVLWDHVDRLGSEHLKQFLFDAELGQFLGAPKGRSLFVQFIKAIENDHDRLMMELNRFSGMFTWPKRLANAVEQARTPTS